MLKYVRCTDAAAAQAQSYKLTSESSPPLPFAGRGDMCEYVRGLAYVCAGARTAAACARVRVCVRMSGQVYYNVRHVVCLIDWF